VTDHRRHVAAAEFRSRAAAVAAGARARGLDAVLVWSRGGGALDACGPVLWLTNYYNPWGAVPDSRCWSGQSTCAALVTADGGCTLVTNVPRGEWAGSLVVCDDATDDPFMHRSAATALRTSGHAGGRVGLAGRVHLSVHLHDLLRAELPDVEWVDADDVLVEAMRPKSAAEHDLIRGAGRAADATMVAMLQAAVPGATERDVARAGFDAGLAHDAVPFLVALATGPAEDRYAPSTLPTWSSRTLEAGDIWHLDLGGSYGGYVFDVARTTVVGGAPRPEQEAMMEAAIATVEAVLERIEPGRPIGEAVAHGHRVRAAHAPDLPPPGRHDYPHLGHTLGCGFGDIWLYEDERRPFERGMYVAVEAVVPRAGNGFAMFEQNVLVGHDAVELLTTAPTRPWTTG
jgi:Xaa-Pro aminopeptidase